MKKKSDESEVLNKLEGLGRGMLKEIDEGEAPTFECLLRSRGNILFDENAGYIKLGDKREMRTFLNVGQAKKFMQTVAVASKCKKFLKENSHTSIRGLFYQLKFTLGDNVDEDLFSEQSESNPLVEDLEVALDIKREDLNLNTDRKGVVAGNLVLRDKFGGATDEIDCSKQGRSGWMIPSDVDNGMDFVSVDADYVLCLPPFEKITVLENGRLKIAAISDIVENEKKNLQVLSFDDSYKIRKNRVVSVYKRNSRPGERLVKITSKSGSVIHVSEDHKLPVLRSGNIEVIRAREVKDGDFLLEAKKIGCLNEGGIEKIDLIEMLSKSEYLDQVMVAGASNILNNPREIATKLELFITKKFGKKSYTYPYTYLVSGWKERDSIPLKYYLKMERDKSFRSNLRIFFRGAKKKNLVPALIEVDESFCKLLGYYLAEGHTYRNSVGFSLGSHEVDYQKEVRELIKKVLGLNTVSYAHKNEVQLFIQNKAIAYLFREMGLGLNSHEKTVPDFVYSLSGSYIKSLVRGYLNGDGYRNTFCTVSENLQVGMNLLLKILGVPSYKAERRNDRGFNAYQNALIHHTAFIEDYFEETARDRTPHYLWERYPLSLVEGESKNELFSPYFANSYKTITRARVEHSENEEVKRWLDADIHPVMVRKVEFLDYSGPLYDIASVVPTHVFMHASGIFSHNCVEKDALWQRLNEDKFWKKENCILITPKGQSSRGCRRLIRRLADKKLPVYCFTDCDAWGWYIYWTIKTGSMNLAYLGSDIATPEARFIGVTMKDIIDYDFLSKLTIKTKDVDLKRAEEMLTYPWITAHKEWVEELKTVLATKKKIEQDALQGPRLSFVGEYVREKIENKRFLP